MPIMRAKMRVNGVKLFPEGVEPHTQENLSFAAVAKSGGYPIDGLDEDNSFAKWSPSGSLTLTVANPDLFGKFAVGDTFYVDFTAVPAPAPAAE